jgi:hypothetical protein
VTVAHADVRIALSAGLISAALTIGGPCIAAASADPGHSGSNHSRHGGDSNRDRQYDRRDGDRRGDDGDRRRADSYQSGEDRDGWNGRDDDAPAKGDYERTGGDQIASRPAAQPTTTSRNTVVTGDARPPIDEPGGGSGAQGGVAPIEAPRVSFGNGRTPGVLKTAPGNTAVGNPVPAPASSAPAPPPPAPISPPTALMAVEPASQEFIDRIWAPLRPTFGSGLLFGLAGLVIMPLSGVWLGYRQARAAKAASKLVSH